MEHRKLGSSGLYVSEVGLGCNNFGQRVDEKGTQRVVEAAIDHGVTLFDTADVYGGSLSEEYLGKALVGKRHDVVLATKFGMSMGEGQLMKGGSRRYIMNAVEASLKRLGTDYIDLYQLHFPDPDTPIDETLGALSDVVREGKARYVGCSNFKAYQIADAQWASRQDGHVAFITAQNNMSLIERGVEDEVIPACKHFGLGMLPYFPLAGGLLTGKYKRNEPAPQGARLANAGAYAERALSDTNFDKVEGLTEFARVRERSMLDLAFAWLLSFSEVSSVIAGATSPEQVEANVSAATMQLDEEEHIAVSKLAS